MKKTILLFAIITFFATFAQAQKLVRYQGELVAGYSMEVGDVGFFPENTVGISIMNGISVGRYFSTGVSVGVEFYYDGFEVASVPVFLNLKGYIPVNNNIRPFVSVDLGVFLEWGFMGRDSLIPAVGCAFDVGKGNNAIALSVGYNYSYYKNILFRVGFQF